jgi:signal transduction histidine kinase
MTVLNDEALRALAPGDLQTYRAWQFDPHRRVDLEAFSPAQVATFRDLYASVQHLSRETADARGGGELRDALRSSTLLDVGQRARTLASVDEHEASTQMQRAIHDIRGGALAAMTLVFAHARSTGFGADVRRELHFLARDHLKIMRSAVRGLDGHADAHDLELRPHRLDDILAGVRDLRSPKEGAPRCVELHLGYGGVVTSSCMEAAALKRVLYNLVNNAVVHAAALPIQVWTLGVPPHAPRSARVVVSNTVDAASAAALERNLAPASAGDVLPSFWNGYTTTGSGLGLGSVAETVADAHGLNRVEDAVLRGYVGATIVDGSQFVAWFHWPLAR